MATWVKFSSQSQSHGRRSRKLRKNRPSGRNSRAGDWAITRSAVNKSRILLWPALSRNITLLGPIKSLKCTRIAVSLTNRLSDWNLPTNSEPWTA
jgi:hypothetical protein